MKILYIRFSIDRDNGGYFVCERNLSALQCILGVDNVLICLLSRMSIFSASFSLLTLGNYGLSKYKERQIINRIVEEKVDLVFIEGGMLGSFVKLLHAKRIRTIVFAHNIDSLLYWQRYKNHRSLLNLFRYFSVAYNESRSLKYAYRVMALNNRDANEMQRKYNRYPEIILPITFPNIEINYDRAEKLDIYKPYCLFVGSDFFPNIEGIKWFIENVAPYINYDVRIVGSCCRNCIFKNIFLPANVFLEDFVEDLYSYYINASFVIAPIFSGSGMKTKTIEALRHGKCIVGTSEAFVGIECDYNLIGGLCNTANEFIDCISKLSPNLFNSYAYNLFEKYFTNQVFVSRLHKFLIDEFDCDI